MRLVKCEVPKVYKRTKRLELLEEFIQSGEKCVRIDGWKEQYCNKTSLQSSILAAIKRFNLTQLKCIVRGDEVFLINTLLESPTAYDPEKVIEKLQVLSDKADDDIAVCEADTCQYYDGYGDGLDRAIEIVKRG